MFYAATNVGLMFLIGKRRGVIAYWMESVGLHALSVYSNLKSVELTGSLLFHGLFIGCVFHEGHEGHLVVEMVKDNDVTIHYVEHVGSIVLLHGCVLDVDVFKIANGVERGVTIQSAKACVFAFYAERMYELVYCFVATVVAVHLMCLTHSVWKSQRCLTMAYSHATKRINAYKRTAV